MNVTMEGELQPFSEVPMIAPSIGGTQMFVNHPQVVTYLREQTAHFLITKVNHLLPLGKGVGAEPHRGNSRTRRRTKRKRR